MRVRIIYSAGRHQKKMAWAVFIPLVIYGLFLFASCVKLPMPSSVVLQTSLCKNILYENSAMLKVMQYDNHPDLWQMTGDFVLENLLGFRIDQPRTILAAQMSILKQYEPHAIQTLKKVEEEQPTQAVPNAKPTVKPTDKPQEETTPSVEVQPSQGVKISNTTQKQVDIDALLSEKLSFAKRKKGPTVMIVHTHTTEAFTPSQKFMYQPSDTDRSNDNAFNIVRVGDELEKELKARGIGVVHDKTTHDTDFRYSYRNSLETVEETIKKNPSIQVVLDIHRDAIYFDNGKKLTATTQVGNTRVAQAMLVIGTDQGGLQHPNWRENLKFGVKLHKKMIDKVPGLMRPLMIAPYRYNQHITKGAIIMEIGSNGNTLDEVLKTCPYLADGISAVIKEIP
ncbi:MAG: stage II sporulation protein P [Hyphomonadaceae bacterium]|nr:stage II sporulation protein P [Clostridia bacterium]